jgi:feruloyl esterase
VDGPNAFGNGTNNGPVIDADHDLVEALERWVEQGVGPDRINALREPLRPRQRAYKEGR